MPKTGILTSEQELEYQDIYAKISDQRADFHAQCSCAERKAVAQVANDLGFEIDVNNGAIQYMPTFTPLDIPYELVYVRHGKTEGNTEPRIFQGQVDYADNQLTSVGIKQAEDAADIMDRDFIAKDWIPDLIVYSSLRRAYDTGRKFAERHPEIPEVTLQSTSEMAFGDWDGKLVIDVNHSSYAHLFYIQQNAVVRSGAPHIIREGWLSNGRKVGEEIPAENYVTLLGRMKSALIEVTTQPAFQNIQHHKPRVLMYGHSMAGAAISMLLGHGKTTEESTSLPSGFKALGFDGKYIMPNATPTRLEPKKPF